MTDLEARRPPDFDLSDEALDPAADGRARVRVTAPTPLMIAQHLAGWGALIEVEGSVEVCHELARLGTELVQRYGATEDSAALRLPWLP